MTSEWANYLMANVRFWHKVTVKEQGYPFLRFHHIFNQQQRNHLRSISNNILVAWLS